MSDPSPITPELQAHLETVLATQPPAGPAITLAAAFVRRWFKPRFSGLERLPGRPALFVGNHALLALDAFTFQLLMHYDYGRFLRPLGDRTLFKNRQYADAVIPLGAAVGDPAIVEQLMSSGEDLLLYPGGTYEAVKAPEQRYELMWQKRYGFIRLAAKMGYTIVPFAAVGPDEYYNQHMTGPELQQAQLVQLLTRVGLIPSDLRSDLVPPLPAGVFGSPLPKPKTTFYGFAPAIDLSDYAGKTPDEPLQRRLRKRVADAIDREIKQQLLLRERQRHRDGLLRRILSL